MGKPVVYLSKVNELREAIRGGAYADGSFLSEAQVMRKFGVGRQTAVRILNELVKDGLIVRRPGAGTFLSRLGRRATGRIGLIIHGSDYCELFAPVAKQISQACQASGYGLMFGDVSALDTPERVRRVMELVDKFLADGLDGLVFQPVELVPDAAKINGRIVKRFTDAGVPVALLDSDIVPAPQRSDCDLVSVDHLSVGRRLAQHLREAGARRVVYLMQKDRAPCVRERQTGVALGCEGLPLPGKAVFADPEDRAAVRRMLKRERPDAIACYNDRQAAHLLQTLAQLGVRVPQDVRVTGFDDVLCARLTIPPLTTMHQPCEAIGSTIVKLLVERIREPSLPVRTVLLDSPLVVRQST
jgi:DNA-binding LacI/PurR family transcriptional regulator